MRAMIVNEYGGTPVLAEVPPPEAGPGQVLIRMRAAGMNPMDRSLADGAMRSTMPAIFPMVLGSDAAGAVEKTGEGVSRFAVGDEVFGQLLIPPLGSAGTFAEYVAVTQNAPLALLPDGLDPVVAAALPTVGMTGLAMVESLAPLSGKTVLVVGAGGGVGAFAVQFAVRAGAHVIANVAAAQTERMRGYGAAETVDHTAAPITDTVRLAHPDGIDVLIDLVSDPGTFATHASLVRSGGTAVTARYVADAEALEAAGVTGINFALQPTSDLLKRVTEAVVSGEVAVPPITRIALPDAPALISGATKHRSGSKTVITF